MRYVVDGDTVVLESGEKVRLLGINAPELNHEGGKGKDEPLARQARKALRKLIGSGPVHLVDGVELRDDHGRRLAHLESQAGVNVQQELLRQGLAVAAVFPPNLRNRERYRQVEEEARAVGRGIWSHPYYKPREIEPLPAEQSGFLFLTGRVEKITSSRRYITLWLSPTFALLVDKGDWKEFWAGQPSQYLGRQVIARGWLFEVEGGRRLRVRHPDMLTVAS